MAFSAFVFLKENPLGNGPLCVVRRSQAATILFSSDHSALTLGSKFQCNNVVKKKSTGSGGTEKHTHFPAEVYSASSTFSKIYRLKKNSHKNID